ncbi:MAG: flagellin N-terminal helical domain-containing protein [Caulobacteraceae bacterium]
MPVIATNTAANQAIAYLNTNSAAESTSLEEISSGSKIVSASSDASGLAISTNLTSQATILQEAQTNITSGESALNTASSALTNISDILTRMTSLATEAQSGSSDSASLADINTEFAALTAEVSSIASSTTFNNQNLLTSGSGFTGVTSVTMNTVVADGTMASGYSATPTTYTLSSTDVQGSTAIDPTTALGAALISAGATAGEYYTPSTGGTAVNASTTEAATGAADAALQTPILTSYDVGTATTTLSGAAFQTGATASDTTTVTTANLANVLSTLSTLNTNSTADAATALDTLTQTGGLIDQVSTAQASIGAQLESLQYTGDNVTTTITNLQSASSAITDVDLSSEQTVYTNEQTLTSAAVSALTEANEMQSELLKVLQ